MTRFRPALPVALALALAGGGSAHADTKTPRSVEDARVPASMLTTVATPRTAAKGPKGQARTRLSVSARSGVPGVDSLINFTSQFTEPGFDSDGNPQSVWPFEMVGRDPANGGPSVIGAPIIPVVVDLLGPDGNVAIFNGKPLTLDPRAFVQPLVRSPMFQPFQYNTGFTQFNDAMMRNQFWDVIHHGRGDDDNAYHVFLIPSVKTTRHMKVPFGSWFFGTDADGNIAFALVDGNVFVGLLFPATAPVDGSTPIGAAELAGDMTTKDLTTLLFNNVYLYQGSPSDNCCVLGFHSYDFEPGDAHNGNRERRFVMNFSSWISPGLFGSGFEDITATSHEINEAFNDPFVDDATPWWLNIDPFFGFAICQNNLETGDVIEILTSNAVFPIQMNGRTYHPQNEASISWFRFDSPSRAKNGSYSFPDETTLTTLSPANLLPGCVPAP